MMVGALLAITILGAARQETAAPAPILGLRLGMTTAEADRILKPIGTTSDKDDDEKEEEREGGRLEAWTIQSGPFAKVAFKVGRDGGLAWMTGFVRPGSEIPFEKIAFAQDARRTESIAVWTGLKPVPYRLIAKGAGGKANVITLMALKARD